MTDAPTMADILTTDDPRHGTHNGYANLKCRCNRCCAANSARQKWYRWRAFRGECESDSMTILGAESVTDHVRAGAIAIAAARLSHARIVGGFAAAVQQRLGYDRRFVGQCLRRYRRGGILARNGMCSESVFQGGDDFDVQVVEFTLFAMLGCGEVERRVAQGPEGAKAESAQAGEPRAGRGE